MSAKEVFLENKKFIKMLQATVEALSNADLIDRGISIGNKLLSKSERVIQYTDFTGKGFEQFVEKCLNYFSYPRAMEHNLEYFFKAISEPLGGNEFPDFRIMVGRISPSTKKVVETYEFYLENKTYTNSYSFGTSSVESLIDNVTTKIGEPTRIEGILKKIDKLTCPILVEKFGYEQRKDERLYSISNIAVYQLYELVAFNSTGGFTTKNKEKNQMICPVSSENSILNGSVDDWIRSLIEGIKEDKNSILRAALVRLELTQEKAIAILEDRLLRPYLYQHSKDLGKMIANTELF